MARLLRSTTQQSVVRHPSATGESIQFRPIRVELAEQQRPWQVDTRRLPHSKLRPPTVIAPSVQFQPRPVEVKLVATPRQPYAAHSRLRPPAVVGAVVGVTFRPVELSLAKVPKQPPASHYGLRSPVVVAASIVFAPVRAEIAKQIPRQGTQVQHYKLRPPTVVSPAPVAQLATPIRLSLAKTPRRAFVSHAALFPPDVVGFPAIFAPVKVELAKQVPAQGRQVQRSRLRPPVVTAAAAVAAIAVPIRAKLAASHKPARAFSGLRGPVVVAPAAVAAVLAVPVRMALAATSTASKIAKHYPFGSKLSAPTDVSTAGSGWGFDWGFNWGGGAVGGGTSFPTRILASSPTQARRETHSKLRPPTVVGSPIVFSAIERRLAPPPTQGRVTHPKLRAPIVVGASTVFSPIKRELAPSPTQARAARSKLSEPAVVSPLVFAPIRRVLAAVSTAKDRIRRTPHSEIRPPVKVAPSIVFLPVRTKIAKQIPRQGRATHPKVRLPVVVTPFIRNRCDLDEFAVFCNDLSELAVSPMNLTEVLVSVVGLSETASSSGLLSASAVNPINLMEIPGEC